MKVKYSYYTGRPNELDLHKKASQLTRNDYYTGYKIGITNNPERRAKDYELHATRYNEMLVIYETQSRNFAKTVERQITEYLEGFCDNKIMGGGGNYGQPPYYVYIAREKKT